MGLFSLLEARRGYEAALLLAPAQRAAAQGSIRYNAALAAGDAPAAAAQLLAPGNRAAAQRGIARGAAPTCARHYGRPLFFCHTWKLGCQ